MAKSFENNRRRAMRLSNDRVKGRPPPVDRAVKRDDIATLSHYGKKGAEVANKKRKEMSANAAEAASHYREQEIARADAEVAQRLRETNEDILPLDPDDQKEAA